MLRTLTLTVDDSTWPWVTLVCKHELADGTTRVTGPSKHQYDLVAGAAEVLLHNNLFPIVQDVLNAHKKRTNDR